MSEGLGNTDSRALKWEAIANDAFKQMRERYMMVVDEKNIGAVVEIAEPGVLKSIPEAVVVERDLLLKYGNYGSTAEIGADLLRRWKARMRRDAAVETAAVKPFHFKSAPLAAGWAWQRLSWDPDPTAKMPPTLKAILSRTSTEEAKSLVLYLGSLFDYRFPRVQYLYLQGPGGDGKSRIIECAELMFSKQGYTTMGADDLGDSHSTSCLEGVRLLTFPDIKKPGLPSTGIFKQLTGDETMGVNPKGEQRRNIRLNCKVIISSNNEPKLDGTPADLRRLIYVRLKKHEDGADHAFIDQCRAEASAWAQYCYSQYQVWRQEFPTKDLPASEKALEVVRADSTDGSAQSLVEEHLTIKEGLFTPAHELHEELQRLTKNNFQLVEAVYTILKRTEGVKKRRQPESDSPKRAPAWYGVGIGKESKDARPRDGVQAPD